MCALRPSRKPHPATSILLPDYKRTAAMIDRLVHHAEIINLKGDSYRLKGRDLGRGPVQSEER